MKQQATQSKEQLQAMRDGYEKQIEMYRTQLENLQKQFAAQAQQQSQLLVEANQRYQEALQKCGKPQ